MKNIATAEDILGLKTTDIYFWRVKEILDRAGKNPNVTMEVTCSSKNVPWIVLAGIDDLVDILRGRNVNVYSLPEGTLFPPRDMNGIPIPSVKITGKYLDFGLYETALLGSISQASGIATKSSRFKRKTGESTLLSFGVRRMHPSLAPLIDRNSYLGGCDKVSSVMGAERVGQKPEGTMPHSLLLILGEEEGWRLYDEIIEPEVARIALVDTNCDEKEASVRAGRVFKNLKAVRLDTPSSRRGNFADIVKEVRWELDRNGFNNVGIIVSGGIKEEEIDELRSAGASGFGVGTAISSSPAIDFAMDIVSIEGKSVTKRGKFSGEKNVFRCAQCHGFLVSPNEQELCPKDNSAMENLMKKIVDKGKVLYVENLEKERKYVLDQLRWVG
jgi:nicotinate phosphoribosyltransferase